jgi:galacturan 1,4-alpha-galacturonidase
MFWASFVWQSRNVSLVNYYSNATSDDQYSTTNTDGYDSWNSDTMLIENATITTDDDCVAPKGNTTNLHVKNVTCHGGAGMTIGSVGQYADTPDYVYNVTFENVRCLNSGDCAYIKTWQGDVLNSTTNGDGGGGGSGIVKNITFRNFELENVGLPIQISQCIYAGRGGVGCNTSKIAIEDVHWLNFTGTSRYNIAASLYCSEIHPCPGVTFENVNIAGLNQSLGLPFWNTSIQYEVYQCSNILDQQLSGIPCNRAAPDFFSQGVSENIQ